ncbi:Phototropin [Arachis hypogaea]|nr:Phototropin [Arachis hypogaea]
MFAGLQFTSSPVTSSFQLLRSQWITIMKNDVLMEKDLFCPVRLYVKYYIWRDQIQFQVHKEARQKIQVCSYLQLLAQFIRHGLPVLNKEGNLASLDTDEGGWVFDSSSSEVQYPGVQHIIMIDIHNLQAFALFLQGLETDSATVKKIRQAIDNQTEVTVQLINYTKTGGGAISVALVLNQNAAKVAAASETAAFSQNPALVLAPVIPRVN